MKWFGLGKYYEIIFSVALFVVLDAGILGLNYYNSYRISDDAHAIQLASRQATLSQQVLHQLYQVRDNLHAGYSIDNSVSLLSKSFSQFDEVLDSFIYGGELIGRGQGQDDLLLGTEYSAVDAELLNDINLLWKPYRQNISPVIYSIYGSAIDSDELVQKVNNAINLGVTSNKKLLSLLNEFALVIESKASRKAERIRTIQAVGISLALINFVLILFHFIRKLRRSDKQVEDAQQETTEILTTINDGLFLLDRKYFIGVQYSTSLGRLLGEHDLAGRNFVELLAPLVSDSTLQVAQDYLDMMFSNHVNPDLMADLNPLDCVEIHFPTNGSGFDVRYFVFQFVPVKKSGHLLHLLVTVNDITDRIRLENELKSAKNESVHVLEQLVTVMHISDESFIQFSESMKISLLEINTLLRKPSSKLEQYRNKLAVIARVVHKIKGDAGLVGIEAMQSSIHNFESLIVATQQKPDLSGNDFLPLTVQLNKLHDQLSTIQQLVDNSAIIRGALGISSVDEHKSALLIDPIIDSVKDNISSACDWKNTLTIMVTEIATRYNKNVELNMDELNLEDIPHVYRSGVKDVIVQFVRNAVVHGIENSASRIEMGKSARGNIRIATQLTQDGLTLIVRDDGKGIDLKGIREKLMSKNKLSVDKIQSLSPSKLIGYIFSPGFSTATHVNNDAGRGIGLDIVKNLVNETQGKIFVVYDSNKFTEFKIFIPDNLKQNIA